MSEYSFRTLPFLSFFFVTDVSSELRIKNKTICRLSLFATLLFTGISGCGDRSLPPAVRSTSSLKLSSDEVTIACPAKPRSDYVGSKVCASCHAEIAKSYAAHPMANSLGHVNKVSAIESASESTQFSPPGNRNYRVETSGDHVYHHEIMDGADGTVIYDQRVRVDFAVGSGIRGRSYLTNREGLLFMSSIGWYANGKRWDLSPGYRPESHQRFDRQVSDGCLACHAGRMNPKEGLANTYHADQPFLEESIGCERCHGPGGSHVTRHQRGGDLSLPDFIVNPKTLDLTRQEAACNQCHLQGTRRITRYGRSEFDFRPGDDLSDVWVVNLGAMKQAAEREFPAVTQAQQMHDSQCYKRSGKMVCTSCHDPHRAVVTEDRSTYYDARCASCHTSTQSTCSATVAARSSKSCIECHMPRYAANDVPHTSQTDHRIVRDKSKREESKLLPMISIYNEVGTTLPDWERERATGIFLQEIATRRSDRRLYAEALAHFKSLERRLPDDVPLLLSMGTAYLQSDDHVAGLRCFEAVITQQPKNVQALESLALRHHFSGNLQQARQYYERLIESNPWRAEFYGRYAHVLGQLNELPAAIQAAQKCLELNPTLSHVHIWLAEVYDRNQNPDLADQHRKIHRRLTESGVKSPE